MTLSTKALGFVFLIALAMSAAHADEKKKIRIMNDVPPDSRTVKVECDDLNRLRRDSNGRPLKCETWHSLLATFNCYPDRREDIERSCPDWPGLQDENVPWDEIDRLITEREAARSDLVKELEAERAERSRKLNETLEALEQERRAKQENPEPPGQ